VAVAVTFPKWGMIVEEARVVSWLKKQGEPVEEGEPILEVETEKSVSEVEAPVSGILGKIIASNDETVVVGSLLGVILLEGEGHDAIETVIEDASVPEEAKDAEPSRVSRARKRREPLRRDGDGRRRVSPAARRLASELGVDCDKLSGSGPGGRIQMSDVREAANDASPNPEGNGS
jgi:pyruvate dehydrogenase E2 component (dihydrolipoamide acetyltransferase)